MIRAKIRMSAALLAGTTPIALAATGATAQAGSGWTTVAVPSFPAGSIFTPLTGVDARTDTDAWAVGTTAGSGLHQGEPIYHCSGRASPGTQNPCGAGVRVHPYRRPSASQPKREVRSAPDSEHCVT